MISAVKENSAEYLNVPLLIREKFGVDLKKSFAGRTYEYLILIDDKERVLYVSDYALNWIRASLEDVQGHNYSQTLDHYMNSKYRSILLDTLKNGVNHEGYIETYDLGTHTVSIESSTVLFVNAAGEKMGALLFARDISARIEGVKKMHQYEMMKTINNFATSMSHHLKNPMTAVGGFLQLIKNHTAPENTELYCGWALEELQRMENILERMSHLAPPGEGQMLIALPDLLQGIRRTMETAAKTMKVQVEIDESVPAVIIKGHYEQLREAILCLANNGMEAMPAGGNLTISAHYHLKASMVEIRVVDQGMFTTDLENVFAPFYSSSVDRTGLGLNIAEHVAMSHRGYVKLQPNSNGIGTTASLFLPAAANISCDVAGICIN